MSYIIAVAAPIGGGKTHLVNAIAERLGHAATLHFDRYERLTEQPVEYLLRWMEEGADFSDFSVPNLPEDLNQLKSEKSILDPLTNKEVPPKRFIIFEMPLGREHKDTAKYIDLLIWVEVPLDIALARKLKEFTGIFLAEYEDKTHKDCLIWLDKYLENYLRVIRDVLQIQKRKVSVNADIIIDGQGRFETMVQRAVEEIRKKYPDN